MQNALESPNIELQFNPSNNFQSISNKPTPLNEDKEEQEEEQPTQKKPQFLNKSEYIPVPKRLICFSFTFLFLGIIFLAVGLNEYFTAKDDRARAMSFLIFGCLMFLPGVYYVYQVYSACIAGSPEEREEILGDIPNIQF